MKMNYFTFTYNNNSIVYSLLSFPKNEFPNSQSQIPNFINFPNKFQIIINYYSYFPIKSKLFKIIIMNK